MKASKHDEFLATIDNHKKIIYKIVNSYCKNKEDRKDLEQEIIIQLWHSYDKYNSDYKYSTWMYRIALNVAISYYRREKKIMSPHPFSESSINSISDEDENRTELDEQIQLLQEFINKLNELNKALMLLYLEGKSHEDIAQILGISNSNVATKISRLKQKLKIEFQKKQNL